MKNGEREKARRRRQLGLPEPEAPTKASKALKKLMELAGNVKKAKPKKVGPKESKDKKPKVKEPKP